MPFRVTLETRSRFFIVSTAVVLNQGQCCLPRDQVAMSGDTVACQEWGEGPVLLVGKKAEARRALDI